jgi:putative ABC transport system permease protein
MSGHGPPRWLEALVEWALPSGLSGQGALGDLGEAFERRALASPPRARLWYARQTISIVAYRVLTGSGREGSSDSDLLMDLRWSFRAILRRPGFALSVVGVLGLGLGANVAVYSVVDGTLANTTWWADADRATAIWPELRFSQGQIDMYREQQDVYRAMGGYTELAFAVQNAAGDSESVNGVFISDPLFGELAVQPMLGRGLTEDDSWFGAERVVVIGEALWRRSFGADPGIVGSRINVGGGPATVIGVQGVGGTAPGGRSELWFPLIPDPRDDDYWRAVSFTTVGVLRDGANLELAHDDLMAFTRTLSSLFPMFYPEGYADGIANVTRADEAQRRLVSTPLLLLLGGTVLLMLVTALNVGNLLLGRSIDRRKELAVRASLGASRGRVVHQLLVEGLVLTTLALGVGLGVGSFGGVWIAGLFVEAAVVVNSSVLTPNVVLFAVVAAAIAWLVVNGVPVVHFLRTQRSGLVVKPASGAAVQRSLVAVQAALATLLLVSATLLVATVDNLRRVPLGFDPDDLMTVELSTPEDRVASPAVARDLYGRIIDRVESIPSVASAGLTGWLPLREAAPPTPVNLRSAPADPREAENASMQMVDAGFFEALGVRALEGRLFGGEDRDLERPSAIVVNETLARTLWPDGSAVGQLIAIDPHAWGAWAPVVGVVPDIRSGDIAGPIGPTLYVALAESPSRDVTLVVRTLGPVSGLESELRRAIADVDALVPIRSITSMEDVVRGAYSTAWVMMGLLLLLSALATGLGAIGIYSVLAQYVAMNRRDIGVRMALGAEPEAVVFGVVRSGLILAGAGIAIGSVAAMVSTRFLETLLFDVSALAPSAFVAPVIALSLAAGVAAWIPAARAGRLPPSEVLRSE